MASCKVSIPRRSVSMVLAATMATSMVPAVALATGVDTDGGGVALVSASALDPANLPDGSYTVSIRMTQAYDPTRDSMANSAVSDEGTGGFHTVQLDVVDGQYWVTLNFQPLTLAAFPGFTGYLAQLGYYDNGGATGVLRDAEIVSYWLNGDGTYVVDTYNDPDSSSKAWEGAYPKQLRVRVSKNIIEQGAAESLQRLHVFVPVMDAIQKGSGNQDCLMKLDWTTLVSAAPVVDKAELSQAIADAQGISQGAKSDKAFAALQDAISAAAAVRDDASATAEGVAQAVSALGTAVEAFNASADASQENPYNLTAGVYYAPFITAYDDENVKLVNGCPFSYSMLSKVSFSSVRYNEDGTYLITLMAPSDVTVSALEASSAGQASKSRGYQSGVDAMVVGSATSPVAYWSFTVDSIQNGIDIWVSYSKYDSISTTTASVENAHQTLRFDAVDGTLTASKYAWASELWPAVQDAKALAQGNKSDEAWADLQSAIEAADEVCGKISPMNASLVTQSEVDAATAALKSAVAAFEASPEVITGSYGLMAGTLYKTSVTIKEGRLDYTSKGLPFYGSSYLGTSVKLRADGVYVLNLATRANVTVNSLQVVSDDGEVLSEGYQSGGTQWSIRLQDIDEPVTIKVSYTTSTGVTFDETQVITFATSASGYQDSGRADWSDLWVAVNEANGLDLSASDKSDEAINDFIKARSVAQSVLRNSSKLTQDELDTAQADLVEAVETFKTADEQQGPRTYLLEPGVWYQNIRDAVYDVDGAQVSAPDNPLFGSAHYRLNDDGTFDVEVSGSEKVGSLTVPLDVSYKGADGTMQPAVKAGEGGGYASWRLNVSNLEDPIELSVSYIDRDEQQHDDISLTFSVYGLFTTEDFGFVKLSGTAWSDLFIALQEAKQLRADETLDKIDWAKGNFDVSIMTADLFYVLTTTQVDQGQEATDEQTEMLRAAIETYKAAPTNADVATLQAQIDKAGALEQGKKTDEAFAVLQTAIRAAQEVRDDNQATQEEVLGATEALAQAVKDFENSADVVDRSALADAIAGAQSIKQGDKTDEAFAALARAIADAQAVQGNAQATQGQVDMAVTVLENAIEDFNASPAKPADTLDFANLADGVYSLNVDMYKVDMTTKSMSDNAIDHKVMLEVKDGEYFLTFDFKGLNVGSQLGYLGRMWYFEDGYTFDTWGNPQGSVVEGTVVDYQVDDEGNYVTDDFSEEYGFSRYPNKITVKYVQQARDAGDGWVPLQVFVPIMEAIGGNTGTGTQPVMAKLDLSSLEKATSDDFVGEDDDPVVTPGGSLGEQLGNQQGGGNGVGNGGNGNGGTGTGVDKATIGGAASNKSSIAGKSGLSQTGDAAALATAGMAGIAAVAAAAFAAARRRLGIVGKED